MPLPFDKVQPFDGSYLKMLRWDGEKGVFINPYDSEIEKEGNVPVEIGQWHDNGEKQITIGLGFDYPTGKLYFTKGGRLIGQICRVTTAARWRPGINSRSGVRHVRVNFGAEDFAFQDWNLPMDQIENMLQSRGL
ncbi:hypothetical protein TWF281_011343 [Arthrobotrys megalospora]